MYLTVSPMSFLVAEWWTTFPDGLSSSHPSNLRNQELPAAAKVDWKQTIGSPSRGVPAYHTVDGNQKSGEKTSWGW